MEMCEDLLDRKRDAIRILFVSTKALNEITILWEKCSRLRLKTVICLGGEKSLGMMDQFREKGAECVFKFIIIVA